MSDTSLDSLYAHYPVRHFLLDLNAMFVCRQCGCLDGACRPVSGWSAGMPYPFEQHCLCGGPRPRGERWAGFDFNEVITLCYCCGAALLPSGGKFDLWFCGDCLPRMEAINDVCGRYVIPVGRHSFMGSRWSVPTQPKNLKIAEFAQAIANLFERVFELASYAPRAVVWQCAEQEFSEPQVPLPVYLERLQLTGFHRSHCVMNVCRALKIPVLVAREAGAIDGSAEGDA